ncbi:MAG: hypothetical protein MUF60_11355 [Vicinamibacterales bacterium]|nr:hypothetical protein [Vicinamibacterales bacterium]
MTRRFRSLPATLLVVVAVGGAVPCLAQPAAIELPRGPAMRHDVRPGPGVTATKQLSDYLPSLAGTPGDTAVYVLEGKEPGATAVVLGGTHGNEIAGIMAAIALVERAQVARGRLIVIPHANNSAVSYTDPQRPGPEWIHLTTASGERKFKYGARRTQPQHQGAPDPPKYRHPASTEELDGNEVRNLDRAYPGDERGPLTQRIAAAVMRLLKEERAELGFDLHEAGPESRPGRARDPGPRGAGPEHEAGAVLRQLPRPLAPRVG